MIADKWVLGGYKESLIPHLQYYNIGKLVINKLNFTYILHMQSDICPRAQYEKGRFYNEIKHALRIINK